jgi:tetratricopeptide (TPR) repeat protein
MLRDLLNKMVSTVRGPERPAGALSIEELRAEINELERQVGSASTQRKPQIWNRLGDLYAKGANRKSALSSYGKAIDGYLEDGFFDAAAALCRKMIELEPKVIRARCTLAFLSLGKELRSDAHREIGEYVNASRRSGQEDYAIKRLHLMAEATDSHDTRTMLGEFLLDLGDQEGADRVFGAVNAERNELIDPPMEEQRDRWARLLRRAVTDLEDVPSQVRRPRGL